MISVPEAKSSHPKPLGYPNESSNSRPTYLAPSPYMPMLSAQSKKAGKRHAHSKDLEGQGTFATDTRNQMVFWAHHVVHGGGSTCCCFDWESKGPTLSDV